MKTFERSPEATPLIRALLLALVLPAAASAAAGGSHPSSTVLTSMPSPSVYGQQVTLTATVAPAAAPPADGPRVGSAGGASPLGLPPGGTVTFYDGLAPLGTGTLAGGVATFTTSSLTVGSHTLTAVYVGDDNFVGSTSPELTQVVNPMPSMTALTSSVNPSVFGQATTLTATVSREFLAPPANGPRVGSAGGASQLASPPTGTVTFKDGATSLGTVTLNGSGEATLLTSSLAVGSHTLTAVYGGDASFDVSTSPGLTQTVNQAASTTTLTSSLNPSLLGQSVTLTATVTATSPRSPANGPRVGSAGGASVLTIVGPTGTVTFVDGATTLGTGTLDAGVATFTTSSLTAGSHTITAVYGGDAGFATSTSEPLYQGVNYLQSKTELTSSVNPSVFGQATILTATVTSAAVGSPANGPRISSAGGASPLRGGPTGTVTFKDGATTLVTGTLDGSGVATFATSSLAVGSHTLTAVYSGDTSFAVSTSSPLTQDVNQLSSSTTLTSSVNPSVFGQATILTATVTSAALVSPTKGPRIGSAGGATTLGGGPEGTVTFKDGATTLGTATLSAGVATFSTSSLAAGSHGVTAVYGGDSKFGGSTSAVLTQVVNYPGPVLVAVSPSFGLVTGGQVVTISGTGLTGATSVTFGGIPATIIGATATSLTVRAPGNPVGPVDIVVTTPGGTATLRAAYAYVDPTTIPTLSFWGIVALAGALAAGGVFLLGRGVQAG